MPGPQHEVTDAGIDELADSIGVVGLLHRVQVRVGADSRYEVIAGRRRWLAHRKLGRSMPARLHHRCDDARADQIRAIENLQREEPSAYDLACGLRNLKNQHGWTHVEVARQTGLSEARVKKYLAIFGASDKLLDAIQSQRFAIGIAVELVRHEKLMGEGSARALIRKAAAGELTAADLEARRKRHVGRGERPAREGDPATVAWQRVADRIERLLAAGPPPAEVREAMLTSLTATPPPAAS